MTEAAETSVNSKGMEWTVMEMVRKGNSVRLYNLTHLTTQAG
jgi:hypothetical protein